MAAIQLRPGGREGPVTRQGTATWSSPSESQSPTTLATMRVSGSGIPQQDRSRRGQAHQGSDRLRCR